MKIRDELGAGAPFGTVSGPCAAFSQRFDADMAPPGRESGLRVNSV